MLTATPTHAAKVTVLAPWYQHPLQLLCLCGTRLYAKRTRTSTTVHTKFICEALVGKLQCDQVILFEDTLNAK